MAENPQVDEVTGTETTGHEWDGIRELNTPLPRWWLYIFYATIVWSFGYYIAYPAIPMVSSFTKGMLGYSSRAEVAEKITAAKAGQKIYLDKIEGSSLEEIRTNPDLLEFSLASGRAAFNVNCSQCHGSGAQGVKGYPNLNDDEWLWGGTLDAIHFTIANGVRNDQSDDARTSAMPAFLKDEILDRAGVNDAAEYVLSLSGGGADKEAAARGKAVFSENCVDCHGQNGEGLAEVGAPALNNAIWLYGGDKKTIVETISFSRHGVMPAWGKILDEATIKSLAIFVHSLGGGK